MNTFAFCITLAEYNYFKAIIKLLPRDTCHLLIENNGEMKKFEESRKDFEEIKSLGFETRFLNYEDIKNYENVVASSCFFEHGAESEKFFKLPTKKILIHHSVDSTYSGANHSAQYYITNSEKSIVQTMFTEKNTPKEHEELLTFPQEHLNYGTYSGIYHLDEWEKKRKLPKEVLRKELAEYLEIEIPHDKPIIALLEDDYCHPQQVAKGIKALQDTNKFTIIVKDWNQFREFYPKDTIYWKSNLFAPNLLRFTADYIFAGFLSGTLSSSIMLGLSVIPYYTSLVREKIYSKKWTNFYKAHKQTMENFQGLALNILETEQVVSRLTSEEYWKKYQENIPLMQENNYGKYLIDGAAQKTVDLILKVFNEGDFKNDQLGLAIRPEFIHLYPKYQFKNTQE